MEEIKKYRPTLRACYMGYIVQAIVTNYAPLLFITFRSVYHVSLLQLSFLVTATFAIQLVNDLVMSRLAVKIGIRTTVVASHVLAALGLLMLPVLPELFRNHFIGILIAVCTYSLGASFIEVAISPITEACPCAHKAAALSMLHSFYCWGSAFVIVVSTAYFYLFGIEHWKLLAVLWSIVPIINGIAFARVPIAALPGDKAGSALTVGQLLRNKTVWLLLLLMISAGAAELAVAQWASAFAEAGLGVSKTLGDLLGPTSFALLMGAGRLFYAKARGILHLRRYMPVSALICIAGYGIIMAAPQPWLRLLGCGIVGFGVAVLWPGALSLGASAIPLGGTGLFALLAAGGDIGCTLGPTVVGMVSDARGGDLKKGIALGIVFPIIAFAITFYMGKKRSPKAEPNKQ